MKRIKQIIPATQKVYVEIEIDGSKIPFKVHAWALTEDDKMVLPMVLDNTHKGLICASDAYKNHYSVESKKND